MTNRIEVPTSNAIVTIIGNIGSGKSTALPIIANMLSAQIIEADDLFQTSDPFAKIYLKDMSRWAFANELWLTVKRSQMIDNTIDSSNNNKFLIDSGLLMSWVYTYSHFMAGRITKEEWIFFGELHTNYSSKVLENSSAIFLKYSVPTLMRRIKKRGRVYEQEYYTKKYLNELDSGLAELQILLKKKGVNVIEIKESEVADFQNSREDEKKMLKIIKSRVRYL